MKRLLLVFAAAAAFGQTADYKQCETLKRHGDAKTQACYQQLTRSSDPLQRGEGFEGRHRKGRPPVAGESAAVRTVAGDAVGMDNRLTRRPCAPTV